MSGRGGVIPVVVVIHVSTAWLKRRIEHRENIGFHHIRKWGAGASVELLKLHKSTVDR